MVFPQGDDLGFHGPFSLFLGIGKNNPLLQQNGAEFKKT